MKIAFPSQENNGLGSKVFNHFGTAKFFVLVDIDTNGIEILENQDLDHKHGNCQPMKALGGVEVDAVVVGGIGAGALSKITVTGTKVYRSQDGTVEENLELIKSGKLLEFLPGQTCQGHHGIGGGCNHL